MWVRKGTKQQMRVMAGFADKDADATVTLRLIIRNRDAALQESLGEQPCYDPVHNEDHAALHCIVSDYPRHIQERTGGIERLDREKAQHNNYCALLTVLGIALGVEFFGMLDLLRMDGMPGGFGRVIIALMGALVLFAVVNTATTYLSEEKTA